MRCLGVGIVAGGLWLLGATPIILASGPKVLKLPFERRLDTTIEGFEVAGKPLIEAVLDLAYKYELPMGIEYVDRDAVRRPLTVKLRHASAREAFRALVAQVPTYQVAFSNEIVQIYSPKAREDAANLLNIRIENFELKNEDPTMASVAVWATLGRQLGAIKGYGGSFGVGRPTKITLHLQNARVREIMNDIAVQLGGVWVVKVPPEKLHIFQGELWYLYGPEPPFRVAIIQSLQQLFPADKAQYN